MMSKIKITPGPDCAAGVLRAGIVLCSVVIVSACAQGGRPYSRATGLPQRAPTQLEQEVYLTPEEYGRYSSAQLAAIKAVLDNGEISRSHQWQRIQAIKRRGQGGSVFQGFLGFTY